TSMTAVYRGTTADIVASVEADPSGDGADRELYRLHFGDGSWSAPERLTFNNVIDDSPMIVSLPNGQLRLLWLSGGALMVTSTFDLTVAKNIATIGAAGSFADFRTAVTAAGRIAVVWTDINGDQTSDIWALFYDPTRDSWGSPRNLTADSHLKKFPTAAFDDSGRLIIVFVSSDTKNTAFSGNAALALLRYQLSSDLGLGSDVTIDPPNPMPETGARVTLT